MADRPNKTTSQIQMGGWDDFFRAARCSVSDGLSALDESKPKSILISGPGDGFAFGDGVGAKPDSFFDFFAGSGLATGNRLRLFDSLREDDFLGLSLIVSSRLGSRRSRLIGLTLRPVLRDERLPPRLTEESLPPPSLVVLSLEASKVCPREASQSIKSSAISPAVC